MRHKSFRPRSFFIKEDMIMQKKIKRYTAKIALERQHFTEDGLIFNPVATLT